jgi:hypothetical protein
MVLGIYPVMLPWAKRLRNWVLMKRERFSEQEHNEFGISDSSFSVIWSFTDSSSFIWSGTDTSSSVLSSVSDSSSSSTSVLMTDSDTSSSVLSTN